MVRHRRRSFASKIESIKYIYIYGNWIEEPYLIDRIDFDTDICVRKKKYVHTFTRNPHHSTLKQLTNRTDSSELWTLVFWILVRCLINHGIITVTKMTRVLTIGTFDRTHGFCIAEPDHLCFRLPTSKTLTLEAMIGPHVTSSLSLGVGSQVRLWVVIFACFLSGIWI